MATVEQHVIKSLAEGYGISQSDIKMENRLEHDLGLDSLDLVELAMSLEEDFDIAINDSDMEKVETVGQLVEHLKSLGVRDE